MKNMQVIESIVMNSLFFVILIVATVSNCLLLLVFRRRPGLRTISNRFVINLLITNVATCWLLIPLLLLDNMWLETRRGRLEMTGMILKHESICPIREGLSVGLCTANVLSVLLIGADQYFAVLDPLRYHASINAATSAVMIAVSWLFALAFAVAGGLTVSSNVTSWYVCDGAKPFAVLSSPYQIGFPILFTVLVFSVPFTSVCWIYFSIYSAAHRNSQRARRNGSIAGFNDVISPSPHDYVVVCSSVVDNNNSSSHKSTLHHSSTKSSLKSTSSSIVNSLKRRISNSSLFRYREETRAARISALVIVMALVCWFPFTLLLVLRSPIFDTRLSYYVKQLGVLALTCSAVASPLIFAHRNRRIHKELCRLFRPSKRRYSFYDRYPPKKQRLLPSKQNDVKHKAATFDVLLTLSDSETVRASSVQHQKTRPISSTILSCLSKKNGSGGQNKKKKNKTVSILSKVWIIDRYQQRHNDDDDDDYKVNRLVVDLPEVALEVDTSRSSFSSNSSATSTSTTESSQSSSSSYSSDIITPATTVDVISEKIKPAVES